VAECPGELARSLAAYGNSRPGGQAPGLLTRRMKGMPVEPILVVDDDPTCLCIMTDVLERAGYRVEAANDGTGALARIVDRRYALVVADIFMPRLHGLALVAELERVRPGVPRGRMPLPVVWASPCLPSRSTRMRSSAGCGSSSARAGSTPPPEAGAGQRCVFPRGAKP